MLNYNSILNVMIMQDIGIKIQYAQLSFIDYNGLAYILNIFKCITFHLIFTITG